MTPLPELNANNECLHEDFENRISAAGQCLVLDIYKSPKANNEPLLVVFVHGDSLRNRGYRYIQLYQDAIKDASSRNLIFVALTRPGYQNGRETSTGRHHYHTGDAFRPYIVKSVVTAILRLANHYNAKKVAVIGHSGGGVILTGGLGTEPDFQPDLAVIIASVFDLSAWVAHRGFSRSQWPTEKSISPHKFTANVSPAVEVVAISGSADTNAISKFSADYVDLMKRDGKNARHVDLDGATHNGILRDERLWTMLNDMLRKLE
jgi:alpha-beta hydrolase superfamily lysophospholipase